MQRVLIGQAFKTACCVSTTQVHHHNLMQIFELHGEARHEVLLTEGHM